MTLKLNVMAKTMPVSQNECNWSVVLSLRGKEEGSAKEEERSGMQEGNMILFFLIKG